MTDPKEKDRLAADFLAGALDDAGTRRLLDVLRESPETLEELAGLQDVDLLLEALARTDGVRDRLADAVMVSIADPERKERLARAVLRDVKGKPATFRRGPLLAAAALLLVLGGTAAVLLFPGKETALASIKGSGAGVKVRRGGEVLSGSPGTALYPRDAVEVPAGSSAVIVYPDATRFELGPDAVLRDLAGTDGKGAFLDRGVLTAVVPPQQAGRPLVLSTPHGRAQVLGTTLKLAVTPDGRGATRLEVKEGKVRLTAADGQSVDVPSGHFAVASAGLDLVVRSTPAEVRRGGDSGGVEDTYLYGWPGYQDRNFGVRDRLLVSAGAEGFRTLMRFPDLIGSQPGQVPPGSSVLSATLRFRSINRGPASGATLRIARCLKPWGPGRGSDTPGRQGEATWNAARHGLVAWEVPGARGAGDQSPEPVTVASRVEGTLHLTFDITELVAQWVGGAENLGMVIDALPPFQELALSSSEDAAPEHRPLLVVTFTK